MWWRSSLTHGMRGGCGSISAPRAPGPCLCCPSAATARSLVCGYYVAVYRNAAYHCVEGQHSLCAWRTRPYAPSVVTVWWSELRQEGTRDEHDGLTTDDSRRVGGDRGRGTARPVRGQ